MIVSFNRRLGFPKIIIHRSFDQTEDEIFSVNHFSDEQEPFMDRATLSQFRDAARDVISRKKCMSLAEMFNTELKFAIDTLKSWFDKVIKMRFTDLSYAEQILFKQKNPTVDDTLCAICNFPLDPQADNGWLDHVIKSEYLFLSNIYDQEQLKGMEIGSLNPYPEVVYRLINPFEEFEDFVKNQTPSGNKRDFIDLEDFDTFRDVKAKIDKINIPKSRFAKNNPKNFFKDKLTAYLYSQLIDFETTDKTKGVPISRKFIPNIVAIFSSKNSVHQSHKTGQNEGHSHNFCNKKVTENYSKNPLIAHNHFRFEFLFLMKVLRASVWKTRDINIWGKNPTDINFASIGNQAQFIDTIKYFQQSLGDLAGSLTSSEKAEIRRQCHVFLISRPKTQRTFVSLSEKDQDWVLDYLSTGKGVIHYQLITKLYHVS